MQRLTPRMPPISARHLLPEIKIDNQIRLAIAEMLPTTSLRLAIIKAGPSSRFSQLRRGRVRQFLKKCWRLR